MKEAEPAVRDFVAETFRMFGCWLVSGGGTPADDEREGEANQAVLHYFAGKV